MGRFFKKRSVITLSAISMVCWSVMCGCHNRSIEDDLGIRRQLCRDKQVFTIGFPSGSGQVQLDACEPDINKSISFVANQLNFKVFSERSDTSPDGLWNIRSERNALVVESRQHRVFSVPIKASTMRSLPKWSRDSKFFFYVTSEDYDRGRPFLHCSDDAFDVHVASVESSSQALVGRVCAGVPFDSLEWLYR